MFYKVVSYSYLVSTLCDLASASNTSSLEPVVVLCGEDLATSAVNVGMNGKQPYKDHPLPLAARRVVPVALVGWLEIIMHSINSLVLNMLIKFWHSSS